MTGETQTVHATLHSNEQNCDWRREKHLHRHLSRYSVKTLLFPFGRPASCQLAAAATCQRLSLAWKAPEVFCVLYLYPAEQRRPPFAFFTSWMAVLASNLLLSKSQL